MSGRRWGATWLIACLILSAGNAAAIAKEASSATAVTVPSPIPTVAEAERASEADAIQFARVYMPLELVKTTAVKAARQSMSTEQKTNQSLVSLETRHPGVCEAMIVAVSAALAGVYEREVPIAQQGVALLVRQYFTQKQLAELTNFYASPTGQAVLNGFAGAMDVTDISQKARANPEIALTSADLTALLRPEGLASLSPEQIRDVATFMSSATGLRMQRLSPLVIDEVTRSTNAIVANGRATINAAAIQSIRDFVATSKKPKTK